MTEFTEEFIATARKLLTENPWKHSIIIPVQLEMLDHIERLQARVRSWKLNVSRRVSGNKKHLYMIMKKFYTSPHNQYDNVCGDYQMRKNVYCRTCGKRIKYVEE